MKLNDLLARGTEIGRWMTDDRKLHTYYAVGDDVWVDVEDRRGGSIDPPRLLSRENADCCRHHYKRLAEVRAQFDALPAGQLFDVRERDSHRHVGLYVKTHDGKPQD